MKKSILTILGPVLVFAILTLSGCGSAPAVDDTAHNATVIAGQSAPTESAESPDMQVGTTDSGLGTIVYSEKSRATCKKRRRTGSNLRKSTCDRSIASQPVRAVTENDPAIAVGTAVGPVRPNN